MAGLIFGPPLAAALLATPLSHNLVWRLLLAFGSRRLQEEAAAEAQAAREPF